MSRWCLGAVFVILVLWVGTGVLCWRGGRWEALMGIRGPPYDMVSIDPVSLPDAESWLRFRPYIPSNLPEGWAGVSQVFATDLHNAYAAEWLHIGVEIREGYGVVIMQRPIRTGVPFDVCTSDRFRDRIEALYGIGADHLEHRRALQLPGGEQMIVRVLAPHTVPLERIHQLADSLRPWTDIPNLQRLFSSRWAAEKCLTPYSGENGGAR